MFEGCSERAEGLQVLRVLKEGASSNPIRGEVGM